MSRIAKRLTHDEYADVRDWIIGMAVDNKIPEWPHVIAKQATETLGFRVTAPVIRKAAKSKGIEIFHKERGGRYEKHELEDRVQELERRIGIILEALPGIQQKVNGELL